MPSLRNETTRARLIERLQTLKPETRPKWGQLDAPRMLCHLADCLGMALGEVATHPSNKNAFHRFPLKHLVLYVLPFPKSVPTAPQLLATAPGDFEADRERVVTQMERVARMPRGMGAEHPFFGRLNNEEWNALQGKHTDHHLRQFGL
jgi:hypothetical protein